jgi:hypothetical protein
MFNFTFIEPEITSKCTSGILNTRLSNKIIDLFRRAWAQMKGIEVYITNIISKSDTSINVRFYITGHILIENIST